MTLTPSRGAMATIYDRAADKVEVGWCQCSLHIEKHGKEPDRYCAFGALRRSMMEAGIEMTSAYLQYPLKVVLGGKLPSQWNDNDNRTQAEVVQALRRAAEKLRSGQL
jgi:hypothetical protein